MWSGFGLLRKLYALDAKSLGFETIVIEGATLPVDIGDSVKNTLRGFKNKGFIMDNWINLFSFHLANL